MFWSHLGRCAGKVALSVPGVEDISYADLAVRADAWAGRFAALAGTRARLLIGAEMAADADLIAAYLGALRAGHAVIIGAPGDFDAGRALMRTYAPDLVLRAGEKGCAATATKAGPVPLHPDLCLMLSTSGSTGDPRLVRLSRANVALNAAAIAEYLGLTSDDRALTTLPLHYSYGLSVLHSHLAAGARTVLSDLSVTDPGFAEMAAGAGVTGLAFVPHQIDLTEAQGFDYARLPALRRITQAGGRLAPDTVRRMAAKGRAGGWDFVVMYGQTEAGPRMAWLPPGLAEAGADTIGRAIPGGEFWIEDADGRRVAGPGRSGELVYRGPNVMMGYAEARGDLALGAGPDILRTGDIAEFTADGLVRLIGRAKRFVKLFGLRLSLDRIEARLAQDGIAAYASGVDDRLVILTLPDADRARAARIVADAFSLPTAEVRVAVMPDVPLLPSGKTDMRRIAERARAALDRTPAPRTATSVAAILAEATRSAHAGPGDSFRSLGGDSLSYLHAELALEEHLGHVPQGWEMMPVRDLETASPTAAQGTAIDGDILLRILSVTFVVLVHLNRWPLSGGTWMLLILMGYGLARFQHVLLSEGQLARLALKLLYPIVPIYILMLVVYDAFRREVPEKMYLFFANNYGELGAPLLEPLWFVSLYVQIVAVFLILAAVPGVRRRIAASPFGFGLCGAAVTTLIAAFALRFMPGTGMDELMDEYALFAIPVRTLPVCLPLVFLGFTIFAADTQWRRLLAVAAAISVMAVFPIRSEAYGPLMLSGSLILVMGIRIRAPAAVVRWARLMAGSTLFVYLTHTPILHVVKYATDWHDRMGEWLSMLIVLPLCFAAGIAVQAAFRHADRVGGTLLVRLAAAWRERRLPALR